jgi:hypothetical protein
MSRSTRARWIAWKSDAESDMLLPPTFEKRSVAPFLPSSSARTHDSFLAPLFEDGRTEPGPIERPNRRAVPEPTT